eukprot:TRINITY_DN26272_c0_g1_i1.p1 TRINITY_DN26272_c0_g1~~TRINITY_DN26272_c0_g1_i1.p1  ORF type:complete len:571 (-),score=114.08 TRINITY_DN26272_c0_g1_i1:202-1878(-)
MSRRPRLLRLASLVALLNFHCRTPCATAADADELRELPGLLGDFGRLWETVVVRGEARGQEPDAAKRMGRACFFGLGTPTFELARFVLGRTEPRVVDLVVQDVMDERALSLARQLEEEFGDRVHRAMSGPGGLRGAPCDLAVFSRDSPLFTVERLLQQVDGHVAVAWISLGCITAEGETSSHSCGFLNMMWDKTVLMRRGYCMGHACMARVPASHLSDPNVFEMGCDKLAETSRMDIAQGWTSPAAEFSQDWFVLWNFLRGKNGSFVGDGIYVDIGANFPFEYSNTVVLDRCLGWRGICVEANPGLRPWLDAYRSCQVITKCVADSDAVERPFYGRDGGFSFAVNCSTLAGILDGAGLRGRRIDVLSIDVEHGELGVLQGINLSEWDIRTIIIEVGRGARWLEVETELLVHGYAKVAVLGRDCVYVRLSELPPFSALGAADGEPGRPASDSEARWRRHGSRFLPGFAGGDEVERPLAASKARCDALGADCAGVTCDAKEQACTVRAGASLQASPFAEVSHAKAAGLPIVAAKAPLLPAGWAAFHARVVQEELRAEAQR